MLGKVDELSLQEESDIVIPFIHGENVKVIDGPFNGFDGTIEKINEDKKQKYNILKSVYFTYPMAYYSFLDFVKDLKKSGAKVELVNPYYKPFEEYEEEKLKAFQKELNLIKKQKNKKKGLGDVIKCQVENGIYNVYHTVIRSEADEYDSSSDQQISSAVLVINKEI